MTYRLIHGDCLEVMRGMADSSADSVVTDPPAGISFMGKGWDADKGGRDAWIAWLSSVMAECLRVVKPGGHALVWALPRTSHWTATAIEDAGWEIRDVITHHFGSGFPKSLDVSKAIDKMAGAEREVVGDNPNHRGASQMRNPFTKALGQNGSVTAPATPEAAKWEGWGTALKPATEHWILARKPLIGTVASNVLAWGTGALNVAATRVSMQQGDQKGQFGPHKRGLGEETTNGIYGDGFKRAEHDQSIGRWPPNLLLTHSADCVRVGERRVRGAGWKDSDYVPAREGDVYEGGWTVGGKHYADPDGMETVAAWECSPDCPVRALDGQSGVLTSGQPLDRVHQCKEERVVFEGGFRGAYQHSGYGDTGGASRFYPTFSWEPEYDVPFLYCAKASRRERNEGLRGMPATTKGSNFGMDGPRPHTSPDYQYEASTHNAHPTVKPLALMRWLCRLVTPPGGVLLDPFAGSGTTGVAAIQEGFEAILVEREAEYHAIAEARLEHEASQPRQMSMELTA